MLADDPESYLEGVREESCLRLWMSHWAGSYAAVPANGPAANESQPPPSWLRLLGGEQGPQKNGGSSHVTGV